MTVEPPTIALRVAVIGARSLDAVQQVVSALPAHTGLAIVVCCDGGPELPGALSAANMPVIPVRGQTRLEHDRIFVVPADHQVTFANGELVVDGQPPGVAPIDVLMRCFADEIGREVTGIVLAGHGTDGLLGLKRIKEVGGLTIAQLPEGPDSEMPRAAIDTGMVDLVLSLREIPLRLGSLIRDEAYRASLLDPTSHHEAVDALHDTLRDILTLVRIRSGHDFASYKRATLYRRVSRRMQVCRTDTIGEYHRYLREHPAELSYLLRDFLISVTNFFRDKEAFEALAREVVPKMFAGKTPTDQVRVWVAGCSTGEEAYTIGMLLREHADRLDHPPQIQIFATDIDEEALAEARQGRYPDTIALDVGPERLRRFFVKDNVHYRVTKELRELVLFSAHNLLRDPPFSRLDLISCRNLLIYLNRDAQERALTTFHFGLRSEGHLLLGSSESADSSPLFIVDDSKARIFSRRLLPSSLAFDTVLGRSSRSVMPASASPVGLPSERIASVGELHHRVIEQYAPPSALINEAGDIVHLSEHAGKFLQIGGGELTRNLLRLVMPPLRLDLRTAIYNARQPQRTSDTRIVRFEDDGKPRAIELRVRSLDLPELGRGALLVLFDEITDTTEAPAPTTSSSALEPVVREIEDELRRTRDQLRVTIEQYETSLEELKASNEELQAINEELRSATEELETSKEELQSVNEELTTLNHELKDKVDEVSQANNDLQNLMTSTDIAVVFLDRALNIKRYTPRTHDLFNVLPADVGRPFAHLTHRLASNQLPMLAQSVLQTLRTVELEIPSSEDRQYLVRVLPYRSLEDRIDGVVITFVDVTEVREARDARKRSEERLSAIEERLRLTLGAAPMVVVGLDRALTVAWGYAFGAELAAGSRPITDLFAPGQAERFTRAASSVLETGQGQRVELEAVVADEMRVYDLRIEPSKDGLYVIGFDITPSKQAESTLREADRRKDEFLATLSHELRNPLTPLKVALEVARLAHDDPHQMAQARGIMERQVAVLSQLVDDLLDLSRVTQGKVVLERRVLDPAVVVEAALEATRPLFDQQHHELTVSLPEGELRILGDQGRLAQVLGNLLTNAAKYTPQGGQISITMAADRSRRVVAIRVRDNGMGIAKEVLPRIFEIFVQSRDALGRAQGGLGIGLNLVRRLVELHGGTVSALSEGLGKGSEFVVELPLVD